MASLIAISNAALWTRIIFYHDTECLIAKLGPHFEVHGRHCVCVCICICVCFPIEYITNVWSFVHHCDCIATTRKIPFGFQWKSNTSRSNPFKLRKFWYKSQMAHVKINNGFTDADAIIYYIDHAFSEAHTTLCAPNGPFNVLVKSQHARNKQKESFLPLDYNQLYWGPELCWENGEFAQNWHLLNRIYFCNELQNGVLFLCSSNNCICMSAIVVNFRIRR